jgi:hydrogenase-4 component E
MMLFLIVVFGLSMVYVSSATRIEAYIRVLALQGFILFGMVLLDAGKMPPAVSIFMCVETLGLKAVIIPLFLTHTVRENNIFREIEPYIPSFYSVVIASLIFAAGLAFAFWAKSAGSGVKPMYFGISLAAVITGLFIIISRTKVITHVMGYVMMENGIFMLSLSMASEMPVIVNMGALLDLFVAVFMLGLFTSRINLTFDELDIDSLSNLKD